MIWVLKFESWVKFFFGGLNDSKWQVNNLKLVFSRPFYERNFFYLLDQDGLRLMQALLLCLERLSVKLCANHKMQICGQYLIGVLPIRHEEDKQFSPAELWSDERKAIGDELVSSITIGGKHKQKRIINIVSSFLDRTNVNLCSLIAKLW